MSGRGRKTQQTRDDVLKDLNRSNSLSPEVINESQVDKLKRKTDNARAERRKRMRNQENLNTDLDLARKSYMKSINSTVSISSITIQPATIAISNLTTSSASISSSISTSSNSASNPCTSKTQSLPCNQKAAKISNNLSDELTADEILTQMFGEMNEGLIMNEG